MKLAYCVALGFFFAIGSGLSYSQQAQIPFAQIQRDARLQAMRAPSHANLASATVPEPAPGVSSSAAAPLPAPPASVSSSTGFKRVPAGRSARILNASYLWLNGAHLALAFADIETTQHCIDAHTCREGNPLMPSSAAGKFRVSLGIATYTAASSYWLKKHNSKAWWAGPAVGIAAHSVGLASGLVNR
jgi:hypothetical protein